MRFKIDENPPVEATTLLLEAGHDAFSALQQGLGGLADADIAVVCQREQRILITMATADGQSCQTSGYLWALAPLCTGKLLTRSPVVGHQGEQTACPQ